MHVLRRRSALVARCRTRSGGTLEFAGFDEAAVAALFHVNSSLAAAHTGGGPTHQGWYDAQVYQLDPAPSPSNIIFVSSFDPHEMVLRFRERAEAVQRRGLPPIEGPERQRFLDAARIDFQDFAMLGDATATLEDGILRLEIDLRASDS